jgi:hypothetical protein
MPRVNWLGDLTTSGRDQIKPPILALLEHRSFIMLILLLAFSLFHSYYGDPGQGPASIELRAVSTCGDQDSRRSLWSIVWTCLSTIFLCTWVSLHPNVTFRPETPKTRGSERIWDPLHHFLSYKLPLFMWALLVPEYILSWSIRQFFAAGEIRDKGRCFLSRAKCESLIAVLVPGWTRTHGFFMLMGGFHLFRLPADTPSIPLAPISSEPSDFVIPSGYSSREQEIHVCPLQIDDIPASVLEMLSPTEAEIKDRSKSDGLTKLIVLLQTLWFIIQCIARGRQHLPLTELEVITLAYTMLNFFIYALWWNKPQNVGCPIRVYKTSTAEHKKGGKELEAWEFGGVLAEKIPIYFLGFQDNYVDYTQESSLPMFWAGRPNSEGNANLASTGVSLLAAGFGGIHFIAWYSEFPSHAELILWRVACILMTTVPLAPWITLAIVSGIFELLKSQPSAIISVFLLFLPLYIAGRATSLLVAFTALRSLPDEALIDVDWTSFIPHI